MCRLISAATDPRDKDQCKRADEVRESIWCGVCRATGAEAELLPVHSAEIVDNVAAYITGTHRPGREAAPEGTGVGGTSRAGQQPSLPELPSACVMCAECMSRYAAICPAGAPKCFCGTDASNNSLMVQLSQATPPDHLKSLFGIPMLKRAVRESSELDGADPMDGRTGRFSAHTMADAAAAPAESAAADDAHARRAAERLLDSDPIRFKALEVAIEAGLAMLEYDTQVWLAETTRSVWGRGDPVTLDVTDDHVDHVDLIDVDLDDPHTDDPGTHTDTHTTIITNAASPTSATASTTAVAASSGVRAHDGSTRPREPAQQAQPDGVGERKDEDELQDSKDAGELQRNKTGEDTPVSDAEAAHASSKEAAAQLKRLKSADSRFRTFRVHDSANTGQLTAIRTRLGASNTIATPMATGAAVHALFPSAAEAAVASEFAKTVLKENMGNNVHCPAEWVEYLILSEWTDSFPEVARELTRQREARAAETSATTAVTITEADTEHDATVDVFSVFGSRTSESTPPSAPRSAPNTTPDVQGETTPTTRDGTQDDQTRAAARAAGRCKGQDCVNSAKTGCDHARCGLCCRGCSAHDAAYRQRKQQKQQAQKQQKQPAQRAQHSLPQRQVAQPRHQQQPQQQPQHQQHPQQRLQQQQTQRRDAGIRRQCKGPNCKNQAKAGCDHSRCGKCCVRCTVHGQIPAQRQQPVQQLGRPQAGQQQQNEPHPFLAQGQGPSQSNLQQPQQQGRHQQRQQQPLRTMQQQSTQPQQSTQQHPRPTHPPPQWLSPHPMGPASVSPIPWGPMRQNQWSHAPHSPWDPFQQSHWRPTHPQSPWGYGPPSPQWQPQQQPPSPMMF